MTSRTLFSAVATYRVTVEWPAGQVHPDSVWVDRQENMQDEELGYTVSDVVVG